MTGVEILTSAEVVTETAFNWTAFGVTFGIASLVCMLVGIRCYFDTYERIAFVIFGIAGIVFGVLFGSLIGDGLKTPTSYETEYKVTISDEVSLNEFYEHYEVIDQEGKIFTVREINND